MRHVGEDPRGLALRRTAWESRLSGSRDEAGMSPAASKCSRRSTTWCQHRASTAASGPGQGVQHGRLRVLSVTIRNARLAGPFTLDEHGFCLGRHRTAITDWESQYGPDSAYTTQVAEVALRLSGADVVVPMGGMMRTFRFDQREGAAARRGGARRLYAELRGAQGRDPLSQRASAGRGYRRFIAFSLWRVCRRRRRICRWRCARDLGARRRRHAQHQGRRDRDPYGRCVVCADRGRGEHGGREPSSATRRGTAGGTSRTWSRTSDLHQLYDSDHGKAWRCPHTAFRDTTRPDARPRRSMEFRAMAYFSRS